jgi:hypothetical protein
MVDRISSSHIDPLGDSSLHGVGAQQQAEKVGAGKIAKTDDAASASLLDQASISDEARETYAAEKETLRFSRLAQREKAPVDMDKVTKFRELLDNGRINDYLRSLNTNALADSLLASSSGSFLRSVQGV